MRYAGRALGGRSAAFVARETVRPANWAALANMVRRYPRFGDGARRYFLARGGYPYAFAVRTPAGVVRPTLHSHHDMLTLHEVFCREDYRSGPGLRSAVDVGSNLGISALYFLTRDPAARAWLYEPVPRNVERLRANLAGFEGRYRIEAVAVADQGGEADFAVEPYGRYGGLELELRDTIRVELTHIDAVLREALASTGVIDVLKIDTEGSEARILRAADPALLRRVRRIYVEQPAGSGLALDGFEATRRCDVVRLTNRELEPRRRAAGRPRWPGGRRA